MKVPGTRSYYFWVLLITIGLFSLSLAIGEYINTRRTNELKAQEEKLAIDILSLETQFELLKDASCKVFDRTSLRRELDSLLARLTFMEDQIGEDNPDVFRLKRYYSILQIKDYLITKKVSAECKQNLALILYFYPTKNECDVCRMQDYILKAIRSKYPQVEVYSFDYNIDLPAVKTLITLHSVPENPPVYDINGKLYSSFSSFEDMENVIKPLVTPTSTATSTKNLIKSKK